jgi:hypothetical protein
MSSNVSGKAYALTMLCPIKPGVEGNAAFSDVMRDKLEAWNELRHSPMALVPNTYLCRYYILDDVYSESLPGGGIWDTLSDIWPVLSKKSRLKALPYEEHLQSRYLVFSSNFHGDLEVYLHGMWHHAEQEVRSVWQYCYGFDKVVDAASFAAYAKLCQLDATLFFVGSNDDPLDEQLKALYIKQEFSRFAQTTQDLPATALRQAYREFMLRVKPRDITGPSWPAGAKNELTLQLIPHLIAAKKEGNPQ